MEEFEGEWTDTQPEEFFEKPGCVQGTVENIVREAVDLEHEFCCNALPVSLVGMNSKLMGQYIEYVADRLLIELGCEKLYNTQNPFDWMEMISLQVRAGSAVLCLLAHLILAVLLLSSAVQHA